MPSCAAQSQFQTNGPLGCGCAGGVDVYLSNQGSGGNVSGAGGGSKGGSKGDSKDRSDRGSRRGSRRSRSDRSDRSDRSRRNRNGSSSSGSGSGSSSSGSGSGCCGSDGSRRRCKHACGGIGAHSRGGHGRRAKKHNKKLIGLRPYGWVQQYPYSKRVYFTNIAGF